MDLTCCELICLNPIFEFDSLVYPTYYLTMLFCYNIFIYFFRVAVNVLITISQFGVSTTFLLLIGKNLSDFMHSFFHIDTGPCLMIIIITIFLLPLSMLKSPIDFWY